MVHKKRHDMVLNLGVGPKGNQFSDQTPTPTRFFRNCEEVGLFQDLQNVNPFEETFKKAVEAVKTGQTPLLDKSFQSNPSDDTLHTPNIFPHIIDLQCANDTRDSLLDKSKELDEGIQKKCDSRGQKIDLLSKNVIENPKVILGNIKHKKRKHGILQNCDETKTISAQSIETQNIVNIMTAPNPSCVSNCTAELNNRPLSLKEKIKSTIHNKQIPIVLQLKVPIPKSSPFGRYQKSEKDKFSTFSKNSLKFQSELEKPQSGIFDLSSNRRIKKTSGGPQKEKSDILERNRAAATRCREKKKIYISYLEKLNRELTAKNQRLQLQNVNLSKQIVLLQKELERYKNVHSQSATADDAGTQFGHVDGKDLLNNSVGLLIETSDSEISESKAQGNHSTQCNDNLTTDTIFASGDVSQSESNFIDNNNKQCDQKEIESNSIRESTAPKVRCETGKLTKIHSDHSYFNTVSSSEVGKCLLNSNAVSSKLSSQLLSKEIRSQSYKKYSSCDAALAPAVATTSSGFSCVNPGAVFLNLSLQPLLLLNPSNNVNVPKQQEKT